MIDSANGATAGSKLAPHYEVLARTYHHCEVDIEARIAVAAGSKPLLTSIEMFIIIGAPLATESN